MELIKIDTDHFVVVDDSEIREGDWYIDDTKSIRQSITSDQSYWSKRKEYKKITNSTQPLDTIILKNRDHSQSVGHYYGNGGQLSLQEVKELLGEVDMEKKAEEYADFSNDYVPLTFGYKFNTNTKRDYLAGYNQALEDNKAKRYTEEDLKYMFECGRNYQNNAEITFKVSFEYLLQTKTSWQVEIVDGKLKLKGI